MPLPDWSHQNISPSPPLCFPTQPSIQSLHSDHYTLASLHSNLHPHAQQVNSPVLQGKPKSPDFQTSAQSCSWSLRYLSAGLRKTLNCHLLQNYHVTKFLLGLDPALPSATNMSYNKCIFNYVYVMNSTLSHGVASLICVQPVPPYMAVLPAITSSRTHPNMHRHTSRSRCLPAGVSCSEGCPCPQHMSPRSEPTEGSSEPPTHEGA